MCTLNDLIEFKLWEFKIVFVCDWRNPFEGETPISSSISFSSSFCTYPSYYFPVISFIALKKCTFQPENPLQSNPNLNSLCSENPKSCPTLHCLANDHTLTLLIMLYELEISMFTSSRSFSTVWLIHDYQNKWTDPQFLLPSESTFCSDHVIFKFQMYSNLPF